MVSKKFQAGCWHEIHILNSLLLRAQEAEARAAKPDDGGGAAERYPSPPPPLVRAWEWEREGGAGVLEGVDLGSASVAGVAARRRLPEQMGFRRDEIEAFLE